MWQALIPLVGKVIDNILPDPAVAADAKLKLLELQQKGQLAELDADLRVALGQMEINKVEAASTNWFVAGWRPFVGWACGASFAYAALLEPLMRFGATVWFDYRGTFPVIDTNLTMQILVGLLGLGGLRSFEKSRAAEHRR
jgi:hypothetical protein